MKNIIKIVRFARPLYGIITGISLLILVSSTLQLISPVISKFIIDEISLAITGEGGNIEQITLFITLSFFVSIVAALLTSITNRLGDHLSGELRKYLTDRFYEHTLALPQTFFDSQISGKIANQLARGIENIKNFSTSATNFILPTFLQSILTVSILAYYNIPIALFIASLFPIYYYLTRLSTKQWGKHEEAKNKIEDIYRGRIQEVIANIKLVKSFGTEPSEFSTVSQNLSDSNTIYAKQSRTFHLIDFARNFGLQLVLLAVSIIVFYQTFQRNMSIGELVLIIQLVNLARRPLFSMSFVLTQIQQVESGSKEFFEIMDLKTTEPLQFNHTPKVFPHPTITFKDVTFSYEKEASDVLKNVNITIKDGEKVALVGHSGAGKSTIVNLILKFYKPSEGTITLNDTPYTKLNHIDIRHNIALVLQDNELFSSTIRENAAYGKPDATDKEIWEALKKANASEFVERFKNKLDTEIGERGLKLNSKKKQRIQIARAILKNSQILILDEATSSLDSKSELLVQEAIENLMQDKLVIIIAHRFSTIQNVDKIIVLNDRKVADIGTPQELAQREGIYSELLKYQVEGNKKLLKKFELY